MTTQRKTVFKVVDRETRQGTNSAISRFWAHEYTPSDYIKTYERDTIVRAKKGSLGIFVFKTRKAALRFVNRHASLDDTIILQAKPIGKGKIPIGIAKGGAILDYVLHFYSDRHCRKMPPPKGTICYPAVKVLN